MFEEKERRKEKAKIANTKAKNYLEMMEEIQQEISVIRQSLGSISKLIF